MTDKTSGSEVVKAAWGQWLMAFRWAHFATLTFRRKQSEATVQSQLQRWQPGGHGPSEVTFEKQFQRWVRRLQQRAKQEVAWFYAIERGAGGLLHLHALTAGTERVGARGLAAAWPLGYTRVVAYDGHLGAAHYVCKEIGAGVVQYDVSQRLIK